MVSGIDFGGYAAFFFRFGDPAPRPIIRVIYSETMKQVGHSFRGLEVVIPPCLGSPNSEHVMPHLGYADILVFRLCFMFSFPKIYTSFGVSLAWGALLLNKPTNQNAAVDTSKIGISGQLSSRIHIAVMSEVRAWVVQTPSPEKRGLTSSLRLDALQHFPRLPAPRSTTSPIPASRGSICDCPADAGFDRADLCGMMSSPDSLT